jgi:endonuclease YncB( thermonuclease family)
MGILESIALAGILLFLLALIGICRRLFKRDPLPKKAPNCIWHTTVTRIHRVYDGDTFFADVKGHQPIDKKPVGIRIRGIDTPEIKDRRPAVKKKAYQARDFARKQLKKARKVHLYNVSMRDKYGRILATVFCDRRDLSRMLLKEKLAQPYDGGKKAKW